MKVCVSKLPHENGNRHHLSTDMCSRLAVFPPQVCLRSSVLLPTGNQVCYCCHGSSSSEALPCRCAGHTGHTGVIFRAPWVAFQPRYIITSKLFQFVYLTLFCNFVSSHISVFSKSPPTPPPHIFTFECRDHFPLAALTFSSPSLTIKAHSVYQQAILFPWLVYKIVMCNKRMRQPPPHTHTPPRHPPITPSSLPVHRQLMKVSVKLGRERCALIQPAVTRGGCLLPVQPSSCRTKAANANSNSVFVTTLFFLSLVKNG